MDRGTNSTAPEHTNKKVIITHVIMIKRQYHLHCHMTQITIQNVTWRESVLKIQYTLYTNSLPERVSLCAVSKKRAECVVLESIELNRRKKKRKVCISPTISLAIY